MKLFEYQGMNLMAEYGIPVPERELAVSAESAGAIAAAWGAPVAVKAQVLTGGRGKAGGVRVAKSPGEARAAAAGILDLTIGGYDVNKLLVAKAVDLAHEFYASVLVNRTKKSIECVFSAAGGVEIEEAASSRPGAVRRIELDPFRPPERSELASLLEGAGIDDAASEKIISVLEKLHRLFSEKDCLLAEINPLGLTNAGDVVALDSKIVVDDNALFRHPELEALRNPEEYGPDETEARRAGLSFVGLKGDLGCMVNGAGLAMATMDLVKRFGDEPADFLDIGGSSRPDKVVTALSIILRHRGLRAVLLNIFGGITRCDDIAAGLIEARRKTPLPVPLVIRLVGTNEAEARVILQREGLEAYSDLSEAVERAVTLARAGKEGEAS